MKVVTQVYVTGLPDDITVEEIEKHFQKCGIIKRDPETGKETSRCEPDVVRRCEDQDLSNS